MRLSRLTAFLGFIFTTLFGCAQVPEVRPAVANPAYDERLTKLLPFRTPLIGVEELYAMEERPVLLDARARREFEVSHLPGAVFIGYGKDFDETSLRDIPKDADIVVYCSVGYRSDKMGQDLRERGFTKVRNLYGSLFEWANRGYPLVNPQGLPTDRVHTYNSKWGRWVDNAKIVKVVD